MGHPQAFFPSSPCLSKEPLLKADTFHFQAVRDFGHFAFCGSAHRHVLGGILGLRIIWALYPELFGPWISGNCSPSPFCAARAFGFICLADCMGGYFLVSAWPLETY